ncbi:MAG: MotA/TolQ/ExbB proton channel family protein [Deltaproteobacteria bacterium]|nr:MotA/TolQ/ExbB proton channel family protein [Deltaproteobacteria bacterium]
MIPLIILCIEDYLSAGGIIMIPLIILSVLMWALIINKAFILRQLYRKNMSRKKAAEVVKTDAFPDRHEYKGITALFITEFLSRRALFITEFLSRRSGRSSIDKFILDETVMSVVASLDKNLAFIGILAGVAPLMGLLGTVTGMIATFDIISVFGTGNAKAMAGGISEALITTQTGLLVAIPGLYMRNFLTRRAENLKQRISSLGIYLKRYV